MTILDEILAHKRIEVAAAKRKRDPTGLAIEAKAQSRRPFGFRHALESAPGISVIAEVKRRSPSKGLIREDCDAVEIARAYAEAGAACISVLTDGHFFGGSVQDLISVRAAVDTPLLRKDFVVDLFQIDEARVIGADAVLLIVAALSGEELKRFHEHAHALDLDVLVEVHDEEELEQALAIGSRLIGVNNRDLRTFEVDLATTEKLAAKIHDPEIILVAESGIANAEDVERLERAGATGFLVGELLMRQPDPGDALRTLRRSA
jgi:indole-3-glycerol phosphate synthase